MKTAFASSGLARRWRRDVFFRVSVAITLVLIAASGLYAAWSLFALQARAEHDVQERAQALTEVLAHALARPLFDINSVAVQSVTEAMRSDPDVVMLQVSAIDGTVLARFAPDEASIQQSAKASRPISLNANGRSYQLGRIDVAVSLRGSWLKLRGQILQTALAHLIFTLLICALLLLISQHIQRPFAQIWTALEKLSRGDTEFELNEIEREDQAGRVARSILSFRDALRKLHQSERSSKELVRETKAAIGRMHAIFEGSNDAIALISGRHFFDCNQRALDMFAVPDREAFLRLGPAQLSSEYQPDGRPSVAAAEQEIKRALAHGENRFEWQHRRLDGHEFPAEILLSAFELDGRRVLQATVRDITERKLIERRMQELNEELEARIQSRTRELTDTVRMVAESRSKLQGIVDTALDAVVRIDFEGRIIGWNTQAETMFGWPGEQALGLKLDETIIPLRYREAHRQGMERFISTGTANVVGKRIEIAALHRNGHEFPIELAITRVSLESSAKFEFCAFVRDITQRKKAEDEIRISMERQRELNLLKTRFISMASHEFRTPLATILSSAELLRHYAERLPASERLEMLQTIETAVRRMASMLDDVLLIGKSDADMVAFEPAAVPLKALCERMAQEAMTGMPEGAGHRIAMSMQGQADGALFDEKLLRHILSNLLSNAIKYSPQGGEVAFAIDCDEEQIRFSVSDQGIGMSEQDRARLFETFFRGSNVGSISGTGLGLAIVKRSVDLHGGVIEVHSALGQGSRFTVTLPRLDGVTSEHP